MPLNPEDEKELIRKAYDVSNPGQLQDQLGLYDYVYRSYGKLVHSMAFGYKSKYRGFLDLDIEDYVNSFFERLIKGKALQYCTVRTIKTLLYTEFHRFIVDELRKVARIIEPDKIRIGKLPGYAKIIYRLDGNGDKVINGETGEPVIEYAIVPKRSLPGQRVSLYREDEYSEESNIVEESQEVRKVAMEDFISQEENKQLVRKTLLEMPQIDAQIIYLHDGEELVDKEIADWLNANGITNAEGKKWTVDAIKKRRTRPGGSMDRFRKIFDSISQNEVTPGGR